MKTKKSLSLLLVLCLIVSIFVPSMVMNTSAASFYRPINKAFKISCPGTGLQRDFRYDISAKVTTSEEVWYEFEYYLSNEAAWMVRGNSGHTAGSYIDETTNTNYLLPGRHSFKGKLTDYRDGSLYPSITSDKNTVASDLYVWNYKAYKIVDGVTTTLVSYDKAAGNVTHNDGLTVTSMEVSDIVMGEEPTTMTVFDISNYTSKVLTYRTLKNLTNGKNYVLSFEYYLQYDPSCTAKLLDVSQNASNPAAFNNVNLKNGLHSVNVPFTYVTNQSVDVGFEFSDPSVPMELYIKNIKVICEDEYYINYWTTASAWSKPDAVFDTEYDAEAFVEETKTATYIDINVSDAAAYKLLNITKGDVYTLSFDYYLKNKPQNIANSYFKVYDVTGNSTLTSTYLNNGSGSFSCDIKLKSNITRTDIAPGFSANQTLSDFYLYNFKLVKKGTDTNLFENKAWTYNTAKTVLQENVEIGLDALGVTQKLDFTYGTEKISTIPVPYAATANVEVKYLLDADVDAKLYADTTLIGTFTQDNSVLTAENIHIPQSGLRIVLSNGAAEAGNLYIKGINIEDKDGVVVTDKCSTVDNATEYLFVGYNNVMESVAPIVTGSYDAENNAMIFEGAINATGITLVDGTNQRNEANNANWGIKVDGIMEYTVKDFGMLIARSNKLSSIPEIDMVVNSLNPYIRKISAKNLTSVSDSAAKFSVTVDNVNFAYQAEYVTARTYVVYEKDGVSYVLYSDPAHINAFEDETAVMSVYTSGLQTSLLDVQAETKRNAILNTANDVEAKGSTVYISYNGSDATGDGTIANPYRSAAKIPANVDTVLFERGGIYRGAFTLRSNTTYGAYGEGAKPAIYGSAQNYADESLWTKYSDNVWSISLPNVQEDIGSVIFNNGQRLGYKVLADVTRGSSDYTINSSASDVFFAQSKEYSFCHDTDNKILYMYCSKGNPAALFSSIELAEGKVIMSAPKHSTNIKIDNLAVKYGGAHGINFLGSSNNIEITNCEIAFIGGALSASDTEYVRYGNGIQFINGYSNTVVDNCWIHQCYDAGYTFQNCDATYSKVEKDMTLTNSLIEYCVYNIEIFSKTLDGNIQKNILIENNMLRMAGYGWGAINRVGSNTSAVANIGLFKPEVNYPGIACENFVIRNNVLDNSFRYLISVQNPNGTNTTEGVCETGPVITNNTYVQKAASNLVPRRLGATYEVGTSGGYTTYGKIYQSTDLETMQASVAVFDLDPAEIIFE